MQTMLLAVIARHCLGGGVGCWVQTTEAFQAVILRSNTEGLLEVQAQLDSVIGEQCSVIGEQ